MRNCYCRRCQKVFLEKCPGLLVICSVSNRKDENGDYNVPKAPTEGILFKESKTFLIADNVTKKKQEKCTFSSYVPTNMILKITERQLNYI